ncbi:DUF6153 family protein [Nonomuraea dietziae]|uniref:DUF6153 family protein n=1 Tax=Nonomuraea dietziae TaxID=65515 RepID=UPI0033D1BEFB
MRGSRAATRVSRCILLVVLAVGVCGMHTLGHLGRRTAASTGAAGVHAMAHGPAEPEGGEVGAAPMGAPMPGLDPTSVCVAVLTSLLILLLVARRARARGTAGAAARPAWPGRGVARPPPEPTAVRLARLSVLRL